MILKCWIYGREKGPERESVYYDIPESPVAACARYRSALERILELTLAHAQQDSIREIAREALKGQTEKL